MVYSHEYLITKVSDFQEILKVIILLTKGLKLDSTVGHFHLVHNAAVSHFNIISHIAVPF